MIKPTTVIDALNAMKGVHDRGFTFVNGKGPKEDLALTFSELRAETARRAHHLKALGLQKGDRVALVLPDGHEFIPSSWQRSGRAWCRCRSTRFWPSVSWTRSWRRSSAS